jgi:hypothetical protein
MGIAFVETLAQCVVAGAVDRIIATPTASSSGVASGNFFLDNA